MIRKQRHQLLYELILAASGPDIDSQTEGRTPQNIVPETRNWFTQETRDEFYRYLTDIEATIKLQKNAGTIVELYMLCSQCKLVHLHIL